MRLAQLARTCAFAGIVATACAPPPEPCTDCPDIAGTYRLRADPVYTDDVGNSCEYIYFTGADTVVTLVQNGSSLALSGFYEMKGTLYQNRQLSFDPVTYDQVDIGTITFTYSGTLTGEPGSWRIDGLFNFLLSGEQTCSVSATVVATQES